MMCALLLFFAAQGTGRGPGLISLLDDVARHALGAEPEGYGRHQGHRSQDDEEGGCCQLHRYAQLRDGGERCVDNDGILGDARQKVAPRTIPARKLARSAASIRMRIAAIMLGM
jgi:hypothetical protein